MESFFTTQLNLSIAQERFYVEQINPSIAQKKLEHLDCGWKNAAVKSENSLGSAAATVAGRVSTTDISFAKMADARFRTSTTRLEADMLQPQRHTLMRRFIKIW
jgi:hypothetical protein